MNSLDRYKEFGSSMFMHNCTFWSRFNCLFLLHLFLVKKKERCARCENSLRTERGKTSCEKSVGLLSTLITGRPYSDLSAMSFFVFPVRLISLSSSNLQLRNSQPLNPHYQWSFALSIFVLSCPLFYIFMKQHHRRQFCCFVSISHKRTKSQGGLDGFGKRVGEFGTPC